MNAADPRASPSSSTLKRTVTPIGRGPSCRKKVGVIELLAYTVSSEWLYLRLVNKTKRQMYSIMPQVVSVWCRELGHDVSYTTYYGQGDPASLLPDDLDVVFISASTQASALAYALAKIYRRKGILTVAGGPHAKCFPKDCSRFFDITVTQCDRNLVSDILSGNIDPPAIVATDRPLVSFPSVEERLPEITVAAFHGGHATRTSVISLFGSVGCPYSCNFCTDWNSTYAPVSAEQLKNDLLYVSQHFPKALLGFQDPNFGVRFDETMAVLHAVPSQHRNRYLMQCSMSILTEERMQELAETRCLYVAPGIESWSDYGNKLKMKATTGQDRVTGIADKFCTLRQYVPGLQANFVFGLDIDSGDEPFDLTRDFMQRVPFLWPNLNIVTPYGGTPVYDHLVREDRLLPCMPIALYCSPYLALVLKNYDPITFYDRFIDLLTASTSAALTVKRLLSHDHVALKIARIGQTSAIRHDIREMRRIRDEIRQNPRTRAFHEGRSMALPDFYNRHLDQRLGRYAELLTKADRIPEPASTSDQSSAGEPAQQPEPQRFPIAPRAQRPGSAPLQTELGVRPADLSVM
ncbi:MAG: radical SAM protein [Alphaproteobacteria bacterium]|nr:radical SAM protein [Alphaproteobacteria bacterium]